MLAAFTILVALIIAGDTIAAVSGLPIPGPAIGLMVLSLYFVWCGGAPEPSMARLFDVAAPRFQMFFVPAAVGVVANFDLLASSWVFFAVAIIGGTTLALAVTGRLVQALLNPSPVGADGDA